MRQGWAALLLLVAGPAWAEPVVLPPGEDASVWADALRLAGLSVGARQGVGVELIARGETWLVRVVDSQGRTQVAEIAVPRTEHDREDVAWLARSLLTPSQRAGWSDLGAPLPPPTAPAAPTSTAPATTAPAATSPAITAAPPPAKPAPPPPKSAPPPAKPAPPATTPAKPTTTPAKSAPPATTPAKSTPPATPPPASPGPTTPPPATPAPTTPDAAPAEITPTVAPLVGAYGEAGGTLAWRPDTAIGGSVRAGGGVRTRLFRLGALVEWSPGRALTRLGEDRRVSSLDLTAGLGVTPVPWLDVGLRAGGAARSYTQAGLAITTIVIPVIDLGVSVPIAVAPTVQLTPFAEVAVDLQGTNLWILEDFQGRLSEVQVHGGLSLRIGREGSSEGIF